MLVAMVADGAGKPSGWQGLKLRTAVHSTWALMEVVLKSQGEDVGRVLVRVHSAQGWGSLWAAGQGWWWG